MAGSTSGSVVGAWWWAAASQGGQLPPALDRDHVCAVQLSFQGLGVDIPGIGPTAWFEPFLPSLDPAQRQAVYLAKHAAGDTHLILDWSYEYRNDGGYTYPIPGGDYTQNVPAFVSLIREAVQQGFTVLVSLASDGQDYSPDGGTYGWAWGMANMARLIAAVQNAGLAPYVIWFGGYELMGPGGNWLEDQLDAYYLQLRSLVGQDGYVALELGQGYAKWKDDGDGYLCWSSPSGQAIDVFLQEFPQPINRNWDGCQQDASCLLGPAARNIAPPNQLTWYMRSGTPRGPFHVCGFEYGLYDFVRNYPHDPAGAVQQVDLDRSEIRSLGYPTVG